ncbi:MAG: hypothetical protein HQL47_01410 [Gammaproteobacteria bacterium]|nr:hypothetical protein [Gammaproteobacteria bacterium]
MSKILSVLLIALNLGLYLLIQQQSAKEEASQIIPGGNLVLLSERPVPLKPPPATSLIQAEPKAEFQAKPAAKPEKAKAPTRHCYSYGPLANRLAAVGVIARLKEIAQSQEIREVAAGEQHWLLLDAETPTDKRQLAKALNPASISFGEHKGKMLLAILTQAKAAQKLVDQLKQQGLNPVIEKKTAATPLFWVDFSSAKAKLDPLSLGLLSQQSFLLKFVSCPD